MDTAPLGRHPALTSSEQHVNIGITGDMTTPIASPAIGGPPMPARLWDRRSMLHLSAAGAVVGLTRRSNMLGGDADMNGHRSRTHQVAARLLDAIAAGDTSAIWSMFADGGHVDLPFFGLHITDGATFDAIIGPILGSLTGLTFTAPAFVDINDEHGAIMKYKGHAIVNSTGKEYNQTYISEIYVRRGKVTSFTEYFDTAVILAAYTP